MQARSRTPPWWRRGRGRAWTVDYARGWSVNLGGTCCIPMEVVVAGFSQQRRDLGGILFLFELVDTWSGTLGLLAWLLSIRSRCEGLVPCSRGQ